MLFIIVSWPKSPQCYITPEHTLQLPALYVPASDSFSFLTPPLPIYPVKGNVQFKCSSLCYVSLLQVLAVKIHWRRRQTEHPLDRLCLSWPSVPSWLSPLCLQYFTFVHSCLLLSLSIHLVSKSSSLFLSLPLSLPFFLCI